MKTRAARKRTAAYIYREPGSSRGFTAKEMAQRLGVHVSSIARCSYTPEEMKELRQAERAAEAAAQAGNEAGRKAALSAQAKIRKARFLERYEAREVHRDSQGNPHFPAARELTDFLDRASHNRAKIAGFEACARAIEELIATVPLPAALEVIRSMKSAIQVDRDSFSPVQLHELAEDPTTRPIARVLHELFPEAEAPEFLSREVPKPPRMNGRAKN